MFRVFKNGRSNIRGRQSLKNLKSYGLPRQTISLQIFKGCFPQILLGPFLNTLTQMFDWVLNIPLYSTFLVYTRSKIQEIVQSQQ